MFPVVPLLIKILKICSIVFTPLLTQIEVEESRVELAEFTVSIRLQALWEFCATSS